MSELTHLTERARHIFRHVVESYLETGAPIGSQSLSQSLRTHLSPASIRATMAELEGHGLLYAPHVSAGRMPTQTGLRIFIDGLLQVGELNDRSARRLPRKLTARAALKIFYIRRSMACRDSANAPVWFWHRTMPVPLNMSNLCPLPKIKFWSFWSTNPTMSKTG